MSTGTYGSKKKASAKAPEKLRISFDPYLSKGFGIRLGTVYQPRPLNAREIIVNKIKVIQDDGNGKNFIKENIDLVNSGQSPPSRIKPENHQNNPHFEQLFGDGGEMLQ